MVPDSSLGKQRAKGCAQGCLPQWENQQKETWEETIFPLMAAGTGPLSRAGHRPNMGSHHQSYL